MKIISSQRHIDWNIVEQKVDQIGDAVELPVVFVGECDGEKLYALIDGHHTGAAAREIGATINYTIKDRRECGHDSSWTLEEALEALWIDSNWYDYETGIDIF